MAAENKANNASNDPKKRKRCYLPHNKPVRKKGPSPIRPGVQGFFITCDGGREFQAAQEAINVIDSFFEELINGKESSSKVAVTLEKPINKKIKFTYSDSDEEENDDDDGEEDKKSTGPPVDGVNNGSSVEEISDHTDKAVQAQEVGPEDGGSKDADKEPAEVESKETEEPPEKKQCSDVKRSERGNTGDATTELSVDKLIEAELKELGDKTKRRFSKLDTGCNGVVFILMRRRDGDPSPTDIVQHIMESAATTKKHMSRFLLRVLPVEVSCYASDEEISRAIKPLVEQHFPADSETPIKFAVQYDARANSGIERMKIIDAVAKSVPNSHKVDLKNPEKTIIAQVVKTVCMISVVDKYKELAKYNLRELTS
ncbi:hypothetical protein KSS87_019669 [Heliosperma pusillum]|nr:hypothetical protein KSS87_019669 [Heliosperma pusillum]